MGDPATLIHWHSCPNRPLVWFATRDALFHLVASPALILALLASLLWITTETLRITRPQRAYLLSSLLLCASLVYTPLGTHLLTSLLLLQLPKPTITQPSVAVLVGRGPVIAQTSTTLAAGLERWGVIHAIYVSGDQRATAEMLVALGVPPAKVAGDDCARTTWENAVITAAWLRVQNHGTNVPAINLITDPWQLPRATLAFKRQGVSVKPLAAPVDHLSAREQNRLALRETAALLLYRIQGRA